MYTRRSKKVESVEKGKGIIIAVSTIILTFDFLSSVFSFLTSSNTYRALILCSLKLLIECIILFFLFKGHNWAKIITSAILIIYGIIPLMTFLLTCSLSRLIIAVFYLIFGIALLVSKDVKSYIDYKKDKIKTDSSDNFYGDF